MKQLFYVLLILGLIYFCYWYITRTPDIVEVTGIIKVIEGNPKKTFYNASIHGTALNTGDTAAKEIWITYRIGEEEVTAFIGELQPGQNINFRTGITRTDNKEPNFELISVEYNR